MKDIFPAIETPRLFLRCVEERDAAPFSALMTPAVSRWVASWPSPFSMDEALERIAKGRDAAEKGTALPITIVRRDDSTVLGYAGVVRTAPSSAGFGYWLGEAFHGRGYMREAAPAALGLGFQCLGVELIEAAAQLGNSASLAVMAACGMRHVDDRMVHAPSRGRDELCAWYAITAAEWAARAG